MLSFILQPEGRPNPQFVHLIAKVTNCFLISDAGEP